MLTENATHIASFANQYRAAFTLAEVLITLGTIGIVAALTLPNLIQGYQKRVTVTRLQNVYSTISQAAQKGQAEYGDSENWDYTLSGNDFFDKYLFDINKVSRVKFNTVAPDYKTRNDNGLFRAYVFAQHKSKSNVITLPNGAWIIYFDALHYPGSTSGYIPILADINGAQNPNIMGIDLFYLYLLPNGKVVFNQSNNSESRDQLDRSRNELMNGTSRYSCKNEGAWCGAVIQRDGWHIAKDYPWK